MLLFQNFESRIVEDCCYTPCCLFRTQDFQELVSQGLIFSSQRNCGENSQVPNSACLSGKNFSSWKARKKHIGFKNIWEVRPSNISRVPDLRVDHKSQVRMRKKSVDFWLCPCCTHLFPRREPPTNPWQLQRRSCPDNLQQHVKWEGQRPSKT